MLSAIPKLTFFKLVDGLPVIQELGSSQRKRSLRRDADFSLMWIASGSPTMQGLKGLLCPPPMIRPHRGKRQRLTGLARFLARRSSALAKFVSRDPTAGAAALNHSHAVNFSWSRTKRVELVFRSFFSCRSLRLL